jgi:hypothetical protein
MRRIWEGEAATLPDFLGINYFPMLQNAEASVLTFTDDS